MSSPSSSDLQTTQQAQQPQSQPQQQPPHSILRPRRLSLKIPIPPHHWSPAIDDLSACVTQMLRAKPSPRRSQPDFYFCSTEAQPTAPPSTPTDEALSPSWKAKNRRVHWSDADDESGGESGRASQDSERG